MRIRMGISAIAITAIAAGCSATAPTGDGVDPGADTAVRTPFDAVTRAQNVADQVEQRQADLEAQLNNPFEQP